MITSSSNPRIKQLALWQAKAKERRAAGIFLVEGFKMFLEAPEAQIKEVYLSGEAAEKAGEYPEVREKLKRTGYETVAPGIFGKISDTLTPQGILCVMMRPEYRLEELLAIHRPVFMVLENLQDPGNLGTIVRTGEGAGITGILMSEGTVDIYNAKTIRATMGSVYRVPFVYVEDLCGTIRLLRERGIRTYAAHLAGEKSYADFSYREGTAFLIGNEGKGLSAELAGSADQYLKIPMEGRVESLNAAISAALLMYEAYRQRQ